MKIVVKGKTYDTSTATKVASYHYLGEVGGEVEATLLRAPGGAFFVHHEWPDENERPRHLVTVLADSDLSVLIKIADSLVIIDAVALGEYLPHEDDGVNFLDARKEKNNTQSF